MEIYCVKEVEQNPLPSQAKPFYIGTKEAPSDEYRGFLLADLYIASCVIDRVMRSNTYACIFYYSGAPT